MAAAVPLFIGNGQPKKCQFGNFCWRPSCFHHHPGGEARALFVSAVAMHWKDLAEGLCLPVPMPEGSYSEPHAADRFSLASSAEITQVAREEAAIEKIVGDDMAEAKVDLAVIGEVASDSRLSTPPVPSEEPDPEQGGSFKGEAKPLASTSSFGPALACESVAFAPLMLRSSSSLPRLPEEDLHWEDMGQDSLAASCGHDGNEDENDSQRSLPDQSKEVEQPGPSLLPQEVQREPQPVAEQGVPRQVELCQNIRSLILDMYLLQNPEHYDEMTRQLTFRDFTTSQLYQIYDNACRRFQQEPAEWIRELMSSDDLLRLWLAS